MVSSPRAFPRLADPDPHHWLLSVTKILSSPRTPVFAARVKVSDTPGTLLSVTYSSISSLGRTVLVYIVQLPGSIAQANG